MIFVTWASCLLRSSLYSLMALETVFLDAGGVFIYPNWWRVSDALAKYGVRVAP